MNFSTPIFLVWFLPLFLLVYIAVPSRFKNPIALIGSLLFYAWGAPVFCLVLVASAAIDHFAMRAFLSNRKQVWFWLPLLVNIASLFVFKYFNFFIENAALLFETLGFVFPSYMEIALPLGISFFTFQKISFLVDTKRGDAQPADSFRDYLLFVCLFPQLIAGPIVRFKELSEQLKDRSQNDTWKLKQAGFERFVVGLVKKVFVADVLHTIATPAFDAPLLGAIDAWLGLLAFTFQIYIDFSAYSDMAIGLGWLMGFKFPENFRWPYTAVGPRDFWRRWHITLGAWMRDYLYIPFGGNRHGLTRNWLNLWLVFLFSGLWHGASWTFVVWGLGHGLLISIDRLTPLFERLQGWRSIALTFAATTLLWVWFKAASISAAVAYFSALFSFTVPPQLEILPRAWAVLVLAVIGAFLPVATKQVQVASQPQRITRLLLANLFFLLCLAQVLSQNAKPFIYFRF